MKGIKALAVVLGLGVLLTAGSVTNAAQTQATSVQGVQKAVKTVSSIAITSYPKLKYYQYVDTDFSYDGLAVSVTYSDNTKESLAYGATSTQGDKISVSTNLNLSASTTEHSYSFTVTVGGKSAIYNATFRDFSYATIGNLNFGSAYTIGTADYVDGKVYKFTTGADGGLLVNMSAEAEYAFYMVDGMYRAQDYVYTGNQSEQKIVYLAPETEYYLITSPLKDATKKTYSFKVRKLEKADQISISTEPNVTTYAKGSVTDPNYAGLKIKVHYGNGYEEIVDYSGHTLLGEWFLFAPEYEYDTDGTILPGEYNVGVQLGTLSTSFKIKVSAGDISAAALKLSATSYTYDSKAKTPAVTVTLGGKTLVLNTDYTVAYANNTKAGTATVTVTGKGNYTGTKKTTFTIKSAPVVEETVINLAACSVKLSKTTYTYNKLQQKPAVTVTYKGAKLAATKYNVKYQNNVNVGTATVTLTGKGNVTGTKRLTFTITPAKVTGLKLKAAKKSATVSWGKRSEAGGYEVYVSLKKSTGFAKKATITKNSTVKKTIKKLNSKKNYYFKVRAFKKVSGKTYYGAFSDVKKIKVK